MSEIRRFINSLIVTLVWFGGSDVQPEDDTLLRGSDRDCFTLRRDGDCVAARTVAGILGTDRGGAGHEQRAADGHGRRGDVPPYREGRLAGRRQYPHRVQATGAGPQ